MRLVRVKIHKLALHNTMYSIWKISPRVSHLKKLSLEIRDDCSSRIRFGTWTDSHQWNQIENDGTQRQSSRCREGLSVSEACMALRLKTTTSLMHPTQLQPRQLDLLPLRAYNAFIYGSSPVFCFFTTYTLSPFASYTPCCPLEDIFDYSSYQQY